jgi:hypothetical protein
MLYSELPDLVANPRPSDDTFINKRDQLTHQEGVRLTDFKNTQWKLIQKIPD